MSVDPCRDWRGDVAALALGQLEAADAARVQSHLDGCATCRAALGDLRSTAALLPLVDPAALHVRPAPPADLADRILREVRNARRAQQRQRRRRTLVALAAAAAFVLVAGLVVVLARTGDPPTHEFAVEAPGVDASYALVANDGGTAVRFEHQGLDPEDVYWLWLTDATGERVSAGTFHGSTDRTTVVLQSAMPTDRAVRIWVTDEDDAVVLDSHL
jgi:anti-sigma-K factor RskA